MDVEASLEAADELQEEAALADSRRSDDRRQPGEALLDERIAECEELIELGFASDERRFAARSRPRFVLRSHDLPNFDRLRLPLRLHGLGRLEGERVLRREIRRPTDEDAVYRRGRLDSRSGIQHVAGGRPLALARARAEHDKRFAGVDADPDVEVEPLVLRVELGERPADREACSDRTLRVVLVRLRGPEQGQDRIAAELLERPAVALELGPHPRVIGSDQGFDIFRVELLGARGRADQVDEDRSDHLALLARRQRRRRGVDKRGAALEAEPSFLGILRPACRTRAHG